ncbi:HAD family hydrolase [Clostridium tagluense]|uniref:HAD hydrolase family protein n=1 Tax=Clostridium tagluense TaxID=360422 RepID=UPI001C0B0692|nr:HAD hydrolase family protein [Clostridium tagluense]MBU3130032.1 HAD family hydrolase [Clostridium tagluense]MCB2313505.1 HAD family hydrolase [Clostridium tagluense]MCB2318329.1 HAD family hydrolase [Clostridium tagluense]MCB2323113.1 HAD family hydrolase [Clostridium tagluense]MCB2328096.1 HAD family hydrolase [Clostridium tagluense]
MIFASDLDSTLIYSSRHCTLINEEKLVPVDFYNNCNSSFITKSIQNKLEHINGSMLFIPVTTRSTAQYMRMNYFYDVIRPKYAVVANGGIILKDGKELKTWSDISCSKIKAVVSISTMIKLCSFFLESDFVKSYKTCEDLFIYSIMDEEKLANTFLKGEIAIDYFEVLRLFCSKHNYSLSKQGKKVYIVPNCINKYDPIKYIMELENINTFIAAGDSLLDYPMIEHSNYGVIPSHGELLKAVPVKKLEDTVFITKTSGIFAGEEILDIVHGKLHEVHDVSQDKLHSYIV